VRFTRRLAAVLLLVGVIVAVAVLWAHGSPGGGPPVTTINPKGVVHVTGPVPGSPGFHGGPERRPGLSLANSGNLIRTILIETAIAAVIVAASAVRRQQRRRTRQAAS
jgi:hypothetical protein